MRSKKTGKRGSISIFLCIILSGVILVESVYYYGAWIRAVEADLQRCMHLQLSQALSHYNETLFDSYGLYAVQTGYSSIDTFSSCFPFSDRAISDLYLTDELDSDSLFLCAVAYARIRFPSFITSQIRDAIKDGVDILQNTGFTENMKKADREGGSIIESIFSGKESIEGVLEKAGDILEHLDFFDSVKKINDLVAQWNTALKRSESLLVQGAEGQRFFSGYSDPAAIGAAGDFLSGITDSELPSAIEDLLFNEYLVALFDSQLSNEKREDFYDKNYLQIPFSEIHTENQSDLEYLFTGLDKTMADAMTNTTLVSVRSTLRIAEILLNSSDMQTAKTIGTILSAAITAVSAGSVLLDPEVCKYIVVAVWGFSKGVRDLSDLLDGKIFPLFEYESISDSVSSFLEMGYRDYFRFFFTLIPRQEKTKRCLLILQRDCGSSLPMKAVMETKFMKKNFRMQKGYTVYEKE